MDRVPPQTHWQLLYWSFSVSLILLVLLRDGSIFFLNEFQNDVSIFIDRIFIAFCIIDNVEARKSSPSVATASTISSSSLSSACVSEITSLIYRLSSTTAS
jgi:hypothetical protein